MNQSVVDRLGSTVIDEVISVCSAKDLNVWAVAAPLIVRHIAAKRYKIIVPDQEIVLFKAVTKAPYQVIPESVYIGQLKDHLLQILPTQNRHRLGWYLQQFIKIAAASQNTPNDVVLIWDADTIPLKNLNFINDLGALRYYQGVEFHRPYFDFIRKVFGFEKRYSFSFIAQCFCVKAFWVQAFCAELASKTGKTWVESIIEYLDVNEPAGFSEYETLGSYFLNRYGNDMELINHPWHRNGYQLVGDPSKLTQYELKGLSSCYDYISFEAWDKRHSWSARFKVMKTRLKFFMIGFSQAL